MARDGTGKRVNRRALAGILTVVTIIAASLAWVGGPIEAAPPGQSGSPLTLDIRVGFDGYVQPDTYFPITVTAANDGDDISGELRVEVETERTEYVRPLELPRGSRKEVTFYAAGLTGFESEVQVDLVERGRVLARERVKVQLVRASTLLIGIWSSTPQSLVSLGLVVPSSGETAVALLTADDLPPVGEGWRALDVLAVSDVDTGQLTPEQRAAMRDWVLQGGRLIIVGGVGFQRTLSGLDDFTPVLARDTATVSLEPLDTWSEEGFDEQARLEAPVATGPLAADAQVMVYGGDVPLVAWRRIGYGRVDFLAADPGLEPLHSWEGMPGLWRAILSSGEARPGWAYGFSRDREFARRAVASVPGVSLPSVLHLCGFLTLYVLLVGPVNYFVLRRMKRGELAWFTIPALVLFFSAVAYVTGFQLRGSRAILHRLAVVQIPAGSEVAKVDALFGVWSPRRARYDIQIEPGYLACPMSRDLGGALTGGGQITVEQGQAVTLHGVRIDVGSIQPFLIDGVMADPPRITSTLVYGYADGGVRVVGDVINHSSVGLHDVSLILGRSTYALGNLPAGEVLHVDHSGTFASAGGSALDPFPADGEYGYYLHSDNSLANGLAGMSNCNYYERGDPGRRCNLAASVLNGNTSGGGVYLTGWSDRAPFDTNVLNAASRQIDSTLYIVELEVSYPDDWQQPDRITPGQMIWHLLANPTATYFGSPYDFYLPDYGDPMEIRFEPRAGVSLPEYNALIVHLEGYYDYGTTELVPRVEIWNFDEGRWEQLSLQWGDTYIQEAGPYIDPAGGVEFSILAAEGASTSITRFDITLVNE